MTTKCNLDHLHTKQPEGYIPWFEWAAEMLKTHRQIKCKGCDKYMIWLPKNTQDTDK